MLELEKPAEGIREACGEACLAWVEVSSDCH